ncbi:MAG: retroviral-like aspartic protease family protein [Fibromonadaceae bacterium]|jgi:hypothetical protein|nr:retroviral-like aspartic protease family protein [Fibromonadaceae bacterium]
MQTKAFTTKQNKGLLTRIISEATIFNPYKMKSVKVKALWDTGATCSVISNTIAKRILLKKICYAEMRHANGIERVPVFVTGIKLPNQVIIPELTVLSCKPIHEFDLIIGMDIIAKGDFAITGKNGNTKFSFRMPSIADIDFTT